MFVCRCVHKTVGERMEEVCVLQGREKASVVCACLCVCVCFEERGSGMPLWGFIPTVKPIWYLSTSSSSTAPYITHTLVFACISGIRCTFPSLWTCIKSRALGADCSTHQHVAEVARQPRSACCRIDWMKFLSSSSRQIKSSE